MKPFVRIAIVLAAISMAGAVNAADSGALQNANLEAQTAPNSHEIQARRDDVEARKPISADEKRRLKREAAESRPGPDQESTN